MSKLTTLWNKKKFKSPENTFFPPFWQVAWVEALERPEPQNARREERTSERARGNGARKIWRRTTEMKQAIRRQLEWSSWQGREGEEKKRWKTEKKIFKRTFVNFYSQISQSTCSMFSVRTPMASIAFLFFFSFVSFPSFPKGDQNRRDYKKSRTDESRNAPWTRSGRSALIFEDSGFVRTSLDWNAWFQSRIARSTHYRMSISKTRVRKWRNSNFLELSLSFNWNRDRQTFFFFACD